MTTARLVSPLLALLLFPLVGCTSTGGGLGQVPTSLVDLYDGADPAGGMELEIERDGTIVEMEADIDPAELPEKISQAALAALPGATITGAEIEMQVGGKFWEVKLELDGREWEFILDDAGIVRETEKELARTEAPAAVIAASDAVFPDAIFASVEWIRSDGVVTYHVKKTHEGARYKIVLAEDGKVLRKVREQRAEIEIPVKE